MRKTIKRTIYVLFGLALILWAVSLSPMEYLIKGVRATYLNGENSATIDDKDYFETDLIYAQNPKPWVQNLDSVLWNPSEETWNVLNDNRTVAVAIIREEQLIYEWYAEGYSETSRTNSFSMAKTITAMLTQIAIENGTLRGWDEKVIKYLPELKGEFADQLTFGDLSLMRGGLDWDESYTHAFGITAKAYYGEDVFGLMMGEVPISEMPGERYEYQSGATQLLGMALEKATGKSLSEMAQKWLWTPLNAVDDAEWHVDGERQILCYCCFNSNARDFARLGQLLLNDGKWNGRSIIDSVAVRDYFTPLSTPFYSRSIWLGETDGISYSYFRGKNGQYIIMLPEFDAVLVRLGRDDSPISNQEMRVPIVVEQMVRDYTQKFEENPIDTGW
ncbi:MAG: serine hydrolase [Flavobacteriia bacterium]|nr:serine hydrolase [Flavobacteriia bacterium]